MTCVLREPLLVDCMLRELALLADGLVCIACLANECV